MNKNHYVYLHRSLSDSVVFYVGKGTKNRAYRNSGRTKEWVEKSISGFTVEIIKSNLTNTEAIELEKDLFLEYSGSIVNKVKPATVSVIEYEYLSTLFEISDNSESFLIWKKDAPLLNQGVRRVRGKRAGRLSGGYWGIRLFQKSIKVHRIIHCLSTKQNLNCDMLVDHIDGNPVNNHPLNLRAVTYAQNARNKKTGNARKNEDTGVTGVSRVNLKEYRYYMVQWRTVDCQNRSKSFNIDKYGNDEAFRLACQWRQQMITELNLQGAGYTERHGT